MPHELNPNPDTSKTIAYFATSLNFEIRSRQAKSKIYDGSFGVMCRSVYEHAVQTEVQRANLGLSAVVLRISDRDQ